MRSLSLVYFPSCLPKGAGGFQVRLYVQFPTYIMCLLFSYSQPSNPQIHLNDFFHTKSHLIFNIQFKIDFKMVCIRSLATFLSSLLIFEAGNLVSYVPFPFQDSVVSNNTSEQLRPPPQLWKSAKTALVSLHRPADNPAAAPMS